MPILNLLLILSATVILVLFLLVLISNPRKRNNQTLASFLGSSFVWVFLNLLTNLSTRSSQALILARMTMIGAIAIPLTFVLFALSFSDNRIRKGQLLYYSLAPVLFLLFLPTKYNVVSVGPHGADQVSGPLYTAAFLLLVIYFYIALRILRIKNQSSTKETQSQINYIYYGVLLTLVPSLIVDVALPIFGYDQAVSLGPASVVILSTMTSLAIIKHRFLNIRLVVARSVAYMMSIGSLGFVYGAVAFLLISTVFHSSVAPSTERILNALLAVVLSFTFQPIRHFFDRVSNKLFYRDAFDTQIFLDELNKILVTNIELKNLLEKISELIVYNIKSEYCAFRIKGNNSSIFRTTGMRSTELEDEDFSLFSKQLEKNDGVIVYDDLEDDARLRTIMREHSISVVASLSTRQGPGEEMKNIMIIGDKKSGNAYSGKDIDVVRIIANELAIAVQNALRFEEIRDFTVTLQQKVDDATRQLRRTNEKLKTLDETKDEFISMASHQLRTPLTSVKGYVSMVIEGDAGRITTKQKALLDQAFLSSQRMVYLIADLLNVSRLRTGKFIIDRQPTQLANVIEGELKQLGESAKGRGITIVYNKPKDFPALMLDETKTRQVIMNFADNALYYTKNGGSVEIKLIEKPSSIECIVIDDGIGVPKADQHHLFTKFYRANNARKARPDGTGLGLFMAKKVVVAQGGAIIFHSQEGKGSTFGFTFPKAKILAPTTPS